MPRGEQSSASRPAMSCDGDRLTTRNDDDGGRVLKAKEAPAEGQSVALERADPSAGAQLESAASGWPPGAPFAPTGVRLMESGRKFAPRPPRRSHQSSILDHGGPRYAPGRPFRPVGQCLCLFAHHSLSLNAAARRAAQSIGTKRPACHRPSSSSPPSLRPSSVVDTLVVHCSGPSARPDPMSCLSILSTETDTGAVALKRHSTLASTRNNALSRHRRDPHSLPCADAVRRLPD
uniref:Uncharacterized protein n=1 Tax=Plectus sambesii TaxID=2011161 RepID=A0A914X2U5_9BILA